MNIQISFQRITELFNAKHDKGHSFKRGFKYMALSLALGIACLSAPALAKDNDDLLGDFVDRFVTSNAKSGKPYEPYYDKSKYKQYSAEDLYNQGVKLKNELEAYGYMRAAAEKGHGKALFWMGEYYNKNKDSREAFFWYKKAADSKSDQGQAAYITATMLLEGQGTKKDEAKGVEYLKRAVDKGAADAAVKLSELNRADAKTELGLYNYYCKYQQYDNALKHLTRAVEMDDAIAQALLGVIYLFSDKELNIAKDEKKAFELLSKAAEQDQALGQYYLAGMYAEGIYVTQDYNKAFALCEKAANKDLAQAKYQLGNLYCKEDSPFKDEAKGWELIEQAAKDNWPPAQWRLGIHNIEADKFQEAFPLIKTCAESASENDLRTLAGSTLSYMYYNGLGTEKNYNEAFKWATQSQDMAASKVMLANLYYFGLGTDTHINKCSDLLKQADKQLENSQGEDKETQEELISLLSQKMHLKDMHNNLLNTAEKKRKLADGFLPVSAGIYQNTSQYDSLKAFDAYTQGKAAVEKSDPKGYALLDSSARRGCNQAKIAFANYFLPPDHPLKLKDTVAFDLEGKTLDDKERIQRYLKWMNSAAENGSSTAAKDLAELYREGKYVGKDATQIFKYTKIAAMAKEPEYMYRLGTYYAQGLGCQKDRASAVKWVKQAAHLGSSEAKQWIEDRRGHYVETEVAVGSERVNINTVWDNVDGHFLRCFKRYKGQGFSDQDASIRAALFANNVTVPVYSAFCINNLGTIFNVHGIVTDIFSRYGSNYVVLSYGGDSITACSGVAMTSYYLNKAVSARILWLPDRSIAYIQSINETRDSTRTIYKTVKQWQGPKVKGWEDLL